MDLGLSVAGATRGGRRRHLGISRGGKPDGDRRHRLRGRPSWVAWRPRQPSRSARSICRYRKPQDVLAQRRHSIWYRGLARIPHRRQCAGHIGARRGVKPVCCARGGNCSCARGGAIGIGRLPPDARAPLFHNRCSTGPSSSSPCRSILFGAGADGRGLAPLSGAGGSGRVLDRDEFQLLAL
jgi:hypothetical protein